MKLFLYLFCLLSFKNSYSQKKHIQVFTYLANTQIYGVKEKFTLYYIIDSNIVYKKGNLTYYGFNFSKDSLGYTGVIANDKKSGDILYISDTSNKKIIVQKIFSMKTLVNNKILFFPFLGGGIIMKKNINRNTINFHPVYSILKDNHSIYIKYFEFNKGKTYPTCIVFSFPFEDKEEIKIYSTPTFK